MMYNPNQSLTSTPLIKEATWYQYTPKVREYILANRNRLRIEAFAWEDGNERLYDIWGFNGDEWKANDVYFGEDITIRDEQILQISIRPDEMPQAIKCI